MASRLSTTRCTTSSSPLAAVAPRRNTSRSLAPPPRATMFGCCAVGEVEDLLLAIEQGLPRGLGIRQVHNLHLADEHRVVCGALEAAGASHQPRGELTAAMIDGSSTTIGTR